MIALIWGTQTRILVCVFHPVKSSTIHNGSAYCRTMSIHIFGGRMSHNISAPFKWSAVNRRRERIIHDQRNSVSVGYLGKQFNIQNR